MQIQALLAILTLLINAAVTLAIIYFKNSAKKQNRTDDREDGFIADLREAIKKLEATVLEQDKDIRAIRIELKNRDAEYVLLFQQHATLKAQYEVLSTDHTLLKKQYDATVQELSKFKTDIKEKADLAAKEMKKI